MWTAAPHSRAGAVQSRLSKGKFRAKQQLRISTVHRYFFFLQTIIASIVKPHETCNHRRNHYLHYPHNHNVRADSIPGFNSLLSRRICRDPHPADTKRPGILSAALR